MSSFGLHRIGLIVLSIGVARTRRRDAPAAGEPPCDANSWETTSRSPHG